MAGVLLELTDTGFDDLREALERLQKKVTHLGPVLDEIGAAQVTEVQWRFENEQDHRGWRWRSLSEVTLQLHPSGEDAKILRRSAELYDSVTHHVDPGGDGVFVGTNKVYARIHQLGGYAGRGRKVYIPARPFLGISDEGRKEILEIIKAELEAAA